jgi:hypothetical protein
MVRKLFIVLVIMLVSFNVVLAKDAKIKEKAQPKTQPAPQAQPQAQQAPTVIATQEQKDLLVTDINNMRTQELRAVVLQQLLNEEAAKLRNLQSIFCDQYKLDVEKFRQGLYRYDDATGKFNETEPAKTAPQ